MVIKTASPGVIINEVDLTRGTSDAITSNVAGMVGPFARGPVDELVLIETEAELQKVFGDPTTENADYWYTISNFLEYGGVCYVIRCDDASGGGQTMKNAVTIDINGTSTAVFIKNYDDFEENYDDGVTLQSLFAARTPGAYGNAFGVAIIDAGADQQLTIGTTTIKSANGTAASSATRPDPSIPAGTTLENYEVVKAAAFVAPTAFAAVVTATTESIVLAGEQTIGGVTTTTSRILVKDQTNAAENGIYVTASGVWSRADDADQSANFEFGKAVPVATGSNTGTFYYAGDDNPTIGTTNLPFVATDPAPDALSVFEYVQLGNPLGGGFATGFISSIDTDNNSYTIAISTGTFVGAIGDNSHLENIAGNEISGIISAAESLGSVELYETIDPNDRTVMNTINHPTSYTLAQGNQNFGWTKTPFPGQTARSAAGHLYEWSTLYGTWRAVFELEVGSVIGVAGAFYQMASAEDWYNQQIAFEGIPWYRFANRPGTSPNAAERGAENDELNIIVYDATGDETGSRGNMLESYFGVSKLKGTLTPTGEKNYYHTVINERSSVIYAGAVLPPLGGALTGVNQGYSATGTMVGTGVEANYINAANYTFSEGVNQLTATLGERQIAYNKFTTENVSILDYILQGPAGTNLNDATSLGNFLINITEERRDCMCFLSPMRQDVVGVDSETSTKRIETWANTLTSSSYAVFDSGYKYTYDRFNDVYRYIPLNGDVAGTLVFTSLEAEPYYSPAGISRGQIRNVAKLPYNPGKAQRDILYAARVNPVVTFPGEGTVLFGDKTGLAYSSAFDRINVRRLFLIVEREIAEISRVNLFEFNDQVTRTLFKNNVNPFLRDIQSKRGMYDFLVVCDETNNPPEIIDRNEFVADIYIKPAKSINFITLNFVATKTGASFEESIGLFRGTTQTTGA